ncbi:MAG: hypothetical protein ABL909_00730 [Sphingopyxis sp.]
MKLPSIALDGLPSLSNIPAAHGAIEPTGQLTISGVFDVVVTVILIEVGRGEEPRG